MWEENNARIDLAEKYTIHQLNSSSAQQFLFDTKKIVICVVTTRRNSGGSYNPRYLLQSSTAFHALIGEEQIRTGRKDFSLMVCDVDPVQHPEAKRLSSFIPTIIKRLIEPLSINDEKINIKEKEKQDYVFCLRRAGIAARGGHVLMVEDDTLPKSELLRVLSILLYRTQLSNVAFIKVIKEKDFDLFYLHISIYFFFDRCFTPSVFKDISIPSLSAGWSGSACL